MKIIGGILIVVALLASMVVPASAVDSPAYSTAVDARMTVNIDLTATIENTVRSKVLKESAIRLLGQQTLSFAESTSRIEIIEAFTEKADGRRLTLDPESILTRDAATGLNAAYLSP